MTPEQLEADLTAFVRGLLRRAGVAADVRPDSLLFEQGLLNSLRILDLITFLENALGRRILDRDVKLGNFRSIRVIAQRLGSADGAPNDGAGVCIFSHHSKHLRVSGSLDALQSAGGIAVLDGGTVALGGAALHLLEYFDSVAREWARELGATEQYYPSLIALEVLEQAGYTRSFPQHLAIVQRVDRLESPAYAMTPAVCFHCYPQWRGRTLPAKAVVITARGRCCRYEQEWLAPLERLRDFSMREIIVLGARDEVESARQSLMTRAQELVTRLDLDAHIEPANDPFYGSAADGKRLLQRAGALKYELRLPLDREERAVAVASFNHHADHFGRAFDIHLTSAESAHSGCVALGLERWVLAFLAQYGLDERNWPAEVRSPGTGARA
ncbi:MAG: hypothetical protein ACT4P6_14720 [Gemmatimonadaceae bacterium]